MLFGAGYVFYAREQPPQETQPIVVDGGWLLCVDEVQLKLVAAIKVM